MKNLHFCQCCGYLCVEENSYKGYEIVEDTLLCLFCSTAYHNKVEPLYNGVVKTLEHRRLDMHDCTGC